MPDDQTKHVHDILRHFDSAMLVTHGDGPGLHARPMAIAELAPNCDLWFFSGRRSAKVDEIQHDQKVLVVCQDEHSRYVSLSGSAELVSDPSKARELWRESFQTWFPGGVDDPDLMLIRVRAEEAEYWDNSGTKGMKYLFQATKAYTQGHRPDINEGEQHGKAALK